MSVDPVVWRWHFVHVGFVQLSDTERLNTSYVALLFLSHTLTQTLTESPLTPVEFSQAFTPSSHCFELTAPSPLNPATGGLV